MATPNESEDLTVEARIPGMTLSVGALEGYLSDARIEDPDLARYLYGRMVDDAPEYLIMPRMGGFYEFVSGGRDRYYTFNVFRYVNGWKCQSIECGEMKFIKNKDVERGGCRHVKEAVRIEGTK